MATIVILLDSFFMAKDHAIFRCCVTSISSLLYRFDAIANARTKAIQQCAQVL